MYPKYRVWIAGLVAITACGDNLDAPIDGCVITTWYADTDGDGFGDPATIERACVAPASHVAEAGDCDDGVSTAHPGATEDACGDGIDGDCDGSDPLCSSELDDWTITAGRVVQGPGGELYGEVTFTRYSGAETRGGGGCLLADLVDHGLGAATCTTNADCASVNDGPSGRFGYCTSPDGSGEPKRCWTRPSNNCHRSPTNPPGIKPIPPAGGQHTRPGDTRVRWIVLGCMAAEATPGACATATGYVNSAGPASEWPLPDNLP